VERIARPDLREGFLHALRRPPLPARRERRLQAAIQFAAPRRFAEGRRPQAVGSMSIRCARSSSMSAARYPGVATGGVRAWTDVNR
jgi:hypothetical protein